ncbi:MAG: carboxymuconolactone decarboxylase family protein [Gallionella sp.]|nr:carboxymuconolactone decarboxylase family protein [Gallionella sp.]MDD4946876.1 carboxymuconolactone decarboxylase family protein [Gallionella sp.]
MNTFKLHTLESAPAGALPILEAANKGLGFIPNLYAHLAEAPNALSAYKQLGALLEQSALTPEEQQIVLISASIENRCEYCVAAHSFLARNLVKVDSQRVDALRAESCLQDQKLNTLVAFTRAVVRERGWVVGGQELNDFYAAGYTQQNALEVVLGVTMKTLSNYTNNLIDTPLDATFASEAWQAADDYACSVMAA